MRVQLIQRKAQIGSRISCTLSHGQEVAGILTEIGIEHITVSEAKGERTISVESIIAFQTLDNQAKGSDSSAPPVDQNNTPSTPTSRQDLTEVSGPSSSSTTQSEASAPPEHPTDGPEVSDSPPTAQKLTERADPTDIAIEKLVEIENRFNTEIQNLKLELEFPDLTFPAEELTGWQSTNAVYRWGQIKNKYEYAKKIDELSTKFGRIQQIISNLEALASSFPDSPTLKRFLAYLYSISGNWNAALHNYQASAVQSGDANNWFGVAVSALKLNEEELACYSLEQFFYDVRITDEPNAWYAYVNLLEKFNNFPALRELCKTDEYNIEKAEIKILLDTAAYLLKKTGAETLAIEIMKKRLTGDSPKSLLNEVHQNLDDKPTESYRQFLNKFYNDRIVAEKTMDPTPIGYPSSENASTAHPKPEKRNPKERKHQPQTNALYANAKRAFDTGSLEKAEQLYRQCISESVRRDSAIMDLAMVLVRLERPAEAVTLLEEKRQNLERNRKTAFNNLLISVCQAAGEYGKVIPLLSEALSQTQSGERKVQILWQIANAYMKLEDYPRAEHHFHQALKLHPDNIPVQRNLAICLSRQERYDEAEDILKRIQVTLPDEKTAALLETIQKAKETGEFTLDADNTIEIETTLSSLWELSKFATFFLAHCDLKGISPDRVKDGKYQGSAKDFRHDIERLEKTARDMGTRRPRERSNYWLSAAKLCHDRGTGEEPFYRYLCRGFASMGDAAVMEDRQLDTVRAWYYEALKVYDGIQERTFDEQDAVNALCRFLRSYLGRENIPISPFRRNEDAPVLPQQIRYIADTMESVVSKCEPDTIFEAIGYLCQSRYAKGRMLKSLYEKPEHRDAALQYLKQEGIEIPANITDQEFAALWDTLRRERNLEDTRSISTRLRFLRNNFNLTTAWLEDNIDRIDLELPFELDKQRVVGLRRILEDALELCRQVTFEERERLFNQLVDMSCQGLLREIEEDPTKLSVENFYPIIEGVRNKVEAHREKLYKTSTPKLTLRLPSDMNSYSPNNNREIEVQIVVANENGRSPAESLQLIVQDEEAPFTVGAENIRRNESLRGGEQVILKVPLRLTPKALREQAFTLPISAEYGTRAAENRQQTEVQRLSIQLQTESEFKKIDNPYTYAEGGVVGDRAMFFGRDELINRIAHVIQAARSQSKCVLVFGQKRSGKSSVLYHLNEELTQNEKLLVVDLGNIGGLLDPHATVPLSYQFLYEILDKLKRAIRKRQRVGFSSLDVTIPDDTEFYEGPAPLQRFGKVFETLQELAADKDDWQGVRIVLLIDEFQYIYDRILADNIPKSFMQNWKALLQRNYFNAVLVGQDVMPKFKNDFPNEFGTTQDERVTYLHRDDAEELIVKPIRIQKKESRYRERAVDRIFELTAGSPFYIQIICNRLVNYMNRRQAIYVTEADIEQVKNELIHGQNALGVDKFDNLINSGDTSPNAISDADAEKILKIIADNSRTGPCPRDSINCETDSPIDMILSDLRDRDVVAHKQGHYKIQVGLFEEWLIAHG